MIRWVSIWKDTELIKVGNTLNISLYFDEDSNKKNVNKYFSLISKMCNKCNFEKEYGGVTFNLFVNKHFITLVTLVDYIDESNFSCTEPISLDSKFEKLINNAYQKSFLYDYDCSEKFDKSLESIKHKYSSED